MNDYPATAKFLTVAEKEEVTRRLEQDRSALADEFSMVYFKDAMKDWKIWVHMVSCGAQTVLLYMRRHTDKHL